MHIPRIFRTSCLVASMTVLTAATSCVHAQHDETVPVTQAHGGGPVRSTQHHINCLAPGASLRGCD
jgi:hypothetical protein